MVTASNIFSARILIVDDEESNVSLLKRILAGGGYTAVASTMDPHQTCELHRKHDYALILLGLHMPGMDGPGVMAALKGLVPEHHLPVMMITSQPAHKLSALQAGAKDFISTPFERVEVLRHVRNMLEVRLRQIALQKASAGLQYKGGEQITYSRTAQKPERTQIRWGND